MPRSIPNAPSTHPRWHPCGRRSTASCVHMSRTRRSWSTGITTCWRPTTRLTCCWPELPLPLKLLDLDGSSELAFFSTLSTFGTAADITLSELAIEAFYPANAHTAMRLLRDIGAG